VPLPSQAFGFEVLRNALARGTLVVATRAWAQWVWNVPELYAYPNVTRLNSTRWVGLSPGNMGPDAFDRLATALR